jgi:hypothetical protein
VWLGCYGGPRIGELLALRWTDLDPLRRTVTIEVSGSGMVEGATKTKAGRRTVTLPRRVVAELDAHRVAFPSSSLIFTSTEGDQVRANNLRRRQWAAAVARAELDGFTFHDMRHGRKPLGRCGGLRPGGGEVGRPSVGGFTKSRYAHLFPEHGEALADRLEAFISASTSTPAATVTNIRPARSAPNVRQSHRAPCAAGACIAADLHIYRGR